MEGPGERPVVYEIRVQGQLDESWSDWLNGLTITCEHGVTTLTGPVMDQSALLGILFKIGYFNLKLISVNRIEEEDDHD